MLLKHLYEGPERRQPGTYAGVRFDPDTIERLQELQSDLGVPEPLGSADFHSTLLYSRRFCPDYKAKGELSPVITSDDTTFKLEIWPSNSGEKNVLVLQYTCEWLEERHAELMDKHRATWDHPDYIPHITLSYNVGEWTPKDYTVKFGNKKPIVIVEEYQEVLDLEWSAGAK